MKNWLYVVPLCLAIAACDKIEDPRESKTSLASLTEQQRNLFEKADELRAKGDNQGAMELYQQAAVTSKDSVEAHVAIAEILRSENRAAESADMLTDALLLQPLDVRVLTEMGFSQIARQKYDVAIDYFTKAIAQDADYGAAYSGKGVALDLLGKHKDAQRVYAEAEARKIQTPALINNHALSLIFTGEYEKAARKLEAVSILPDANETMRQNLALAYGLMGNAEGAKELGLKDLNPEEVQQNIAFYKRYTAMQMQPAAGIAGDAAKAVPVTPVSEGEVGYMTGEVPGGGVQQPQVEVLEVDEEEFRTLTGESEMPAE